VRDPSCVGTSVRLNHAAILESNPKGNLSVFSTTISLGQHRGRAGIVVEEYLEPRVRRVPLANDLESVECFHVRPGRQRSGVFRMRSPRHSSKSNPSPSSKRRRSWASSWRSDSSRLSSVFWGTGRAACLSDFLVNCEAYWSADLSCTFSRTKPRSIF
jgi:hypothetical protein